MKRTNIGIPLVSHAAWIGVVLLVGLLLNACEFFASEWGFQEERPGSQPETCVTKVGFTAIGDQIGLEEIENNHSGNYCLTQDITLVGNWEPLATFTGTFDGRGHTISGLKIDKQGIDNVGFFKELGAGAEVKDLTFSQPSVTGRDNVGVLAGISNATTAMTNLQVTDVGAIVNGGTNIGGLVGENAGTIENSHVTGNVSGANYVGGLVGKNTGTIEDSYAMIAGGGIKSAIVGGGFVGRNEGVIKNSYATDGASGAAAVASGGLVGENGNSGTITNSYATGETSSKEIAGGLVGKNAGTIENSYATGEASGDDVAVGGLVGENAGTIKNSYATGKASGIMAAGGLVGKNTSTIENSYATGTVVSLYAGGLVGENGNSGSITNSYFATGTGIGIGKDDNSQTVSSLDETSASKTDFDGWDFPATWTFTQGKWPTLTWQNS